MKMRQFYPGPHQGARWHPEDIIGFPMTTGDYYFVDAARSADGGGKEWEDAFADLDTALSTVSSGDTIYMAPGTYTGNYSTPDDTGARNVSIIGVSPGSRPGIRGGVNMVHSEEDEPVLNIKASGWRASNICFRPGTSSSGIQLTADITTQNYIDGVAGGIAQGVTIDNCMFWGGSTGKYGIVFQGSTDVNAPHYAKIVNNHFQYLYADNAAAIWVASSGNPINGAYVYGNAFTSNYSNIDTYAAMGFIESRFERNSMMYYGAYGMMRGYLVNVRATATPDVTGGNAFVDNFFGCTEAQYADTDGHIRTNGYDYGMGNWVLDNQVTSEINH